MGDAKYKNFDFSYIFFILLAVSVPLAITTLLYNQSDLPKNAALQITGSLYILSVWWMLFENIIKGKSQRDSHLFVFNKELDPFVLIFLFAAILSTVFSINPQVSFTGQYERQYGLTLIIFLVMFYFISSDYFKEKRSIPRLLFAMEIVSVIVAAYAILQWLGIDPFGLQPMNDKRPVSFIGNSVFTGGFLAMNLPVSILNSSAKKNILLKFIFPLVIVLGIAVTGTRSAYVAVIAALVVLALFYPVAMGKGGENFRKKIKLSALILGAGFIFAAIIIIVFNTNPFVQRLLSIFSDGDNPRLALWRDSIQVFLKYPLFGSGLGMFPNALEEFYSVRLRVDEMKKYFDNAHNNYLQVLCTMGITGLAAYILVLFAAIKTCLKNLFSTADKNKKFLFLSLLCAIAAYSVYGLTNFDEISISLYLFLYLAVIRSLCKSSKSYASKFSKKFKIPAVALSLVITVFCTYSVLNIINNIRADSYFVEGFKSFSRQRFSEGVNLINNAILLNSSCGFYRYNLASNVYRFASANYQMNKDSRNNLLNQAADEILRARKTHISINSCDAILAMVYYELNDTAKADSIKTEVLKRDPISMRFRLDLITYYSRAGNTDMAKDNLDFVLQTGFESAGVWNAAAYYYYTTGNREKASYYYNKILSVDPGNKAVIEMLEKMK